MANFKCKMCGAQLEVNEGQTVATCSFCGSKQTVANADDERKENLFNRANALRRNCEFDKAMLSYQSILSIFPTEPEAYWGLCICRYGIEYVDDPKTKSKKPTIHRASFESILKDSDYLSALSYADVVAKEQYQAEAKEIDSIQKNILAISQKEEPFDIFICYKESDENGRRTPDSVMAQEVYDQLVSKGYKVFFSRITLENKLGSMYEPYIFAALNSAKIMLVFGTKKEYFEATWVKNEWSRFIDLMATRPDHYLIPCYKNMDAYEMPDQFLSFQAQNLSKLGFMQDLLRGIDKIMGKDEIAPKVVETTTNVIQSNVNVNALLKRAEILIMDHEYDEANEKLETLLDNDPTNYKAYLLKLVMELNLDSIAALKDCPNTLEHSSNYQKAYRFADDKHKQELEDINNSITNRNKNTIYDRAISFKDNHQYEEAISAFTLLNDYRDAPKQIEECQYLKKKDKYNEAISYKNNNDFLLAINIFRELDNFEDSKHQIEECEYLQKKNRYNKALELKNNQEYDKAIYEFYDLSQVNFEDSDFQVEECKRLKEEIRKEHVYQNYIFNVPNRLLNKSEYKNLKTINIPQLNHIKGYKDVDNLLVIYEGKIHEYDQEQKRLAEINAQKLKAKKKKAGIAALISSGTALTIVGILLLTFLCFVPAGRQNKIISYLNNKNYDDAYKLIQENGSFGDTYNLINMYRAGLSLNSGDYESGISLVLAIDGNVHVDYDLNGGTGSKASDSFGKKTYIKYEPEASIKGYGFEKWVISDYTMKAGKHFIDLDLKAVYSPIEYTIVYNLQGGTLSYKRTSYTVEDSFTLGTPTKAGYTFLGWTGSNGNTPQVNYTQPKGSTGNKTYTANWSANKNALTVTSNNETLGTVSIVSGSGYTNELITVEATPLNDNIFAGWYSGAALVSASNRYSFVMPTNAYSLTAKFITKAEEEEEEARQKALGMIPVIDTTTNTVTYGLYPQTYVSDTTLTTELGKLTTKESNGWYLYNNAYYAKLTAKPYNSGYTFDDGTTIVTSTTYWFKCEPITWQIIKTDNNGYTLLSNVLLDAHRYNEYYQGTKSRVDYNGETATVYPNNYKFSEIRSWLNTSFYNSAFVLNNSYIQTSTVNNAASTTYSSSNSYACENTNDKVYLLSYQDYLNTSYGFTSSTSSTTTRECKTTDYARANGVWYSTSSSYKYNGWYWTRSPYSGSSRNASSVYSDGALSSGRSVYFAYGSVRPSLLIKVA